MLFYGFRGDTLIETTTGPKAIWDIHIDEKVLTHTGKYLPVLAAQRGRYTGKAWEIVIDGENSPKIVRATQKFLSIKTQPCPFRIYGTCRPKCKNLKDCSAKRFRRYSRLWRPIEELSSNEDVAKKSFPDINSSDWVAYPKDGQRMYKTYASKDKHYIYKRLSTKREVKYNDIVYNLVVAEDMSYTLNCGMITHS